MNYLHASPVCKLCIFISGPFYVPVWWSGLSSCEIGVCFLDCQGPIRRGRHPKNCCLHPHLFGRLQELPARVVPLLDCGCHTKTSKLSELSCSCAPDRAWPRAACLEYRTSPRAPCVVIPVTFPLGPCGRYRCPDMAAQ